MTVFHDPKSFCLWRVNRNHPWLLDPGANQTWGKQLCGSDATASVRSVGTSYSILASMQASAGMLTGESEIQEAETTCGETPGNRPGNAVAEEVVGSGEENCVEENRPRPWSPMQGSPLKSTPVSAVSPASLFQVCFRRAPPLIVLLRSLANHLPPSSPRLVSDGHQARQYNGF